MITEKQPPFSNLPSQADPTPEEIRQCCLRIRAEWSETTRRRRSGEANLPWTVPVVQQQRASTPGQPLLN